MSGGKTVGKVTLSAKQADAYGFTPWEVISESFDFSFLIGTGTKLTVPEHYPVYVNGTCLTEEDIVESGIQFALVKDFYAQYSLPTFVTYEVDPILGLLLAHCSNSLTRVSNLTYIVHHMQGGYAAARYSFETPHIYPKVQLTLFVALACLWLWQLASQY